MIQFSRININGFFSSDPLIATAIAAGAVTLTAAAFGAAGGAGAGSAFLAGAAATGGAMYAGIGPFEFANRLPARAWLLHGCLPIRYLAGSDFDASSGAVSIQELEVQPEYIEEFSLGLKP